MIETHHPEGWRRAPGGQLQYWIVSGAHGVLGGIGFGAGGCQLAPRDRLIGWSREASVANIALVVCNSRLLILPEVNVPKLASSVLRMACGRIAEDWRAKHGVRPVLAHAFTAQGRGWCYRAALRRAAGGMGQAPVAGLARAAAPRRAAADRLVASARGRPPRLGAKGVCPVRVSGRPGARAHRGDGAGVDAQAGPPAAGDIPGPGKRRHAGMAAGIRWGCS